MGRPSVASSPSASDSLACRLPLCFWQPGHFRPAHWQPTAEVVVIAPPSPPNQAPSAFTTEGSCPLTCGSGFFLSSFRADATTCNHYRWAGPALGKSGRARKGCIYALVRPIARNSFWFESVRASWFDVGQGSLWILQGGLLRADLRKVLQSSDYASIPWGFITAQILNIHTNVFVVHVDCAVLRRHRASKMVAPFSDSRAAITFHVTEPLTTFTKF
jgi:hypothetical protein